jgi:hypothetical protein
MIFKTKQIFLYSVILVVFFIFMLFSILYETNLNVERLISQRISVVILTKDGERNTQLLKTHFP